MRRRGEMQRQICKWPLDTSHAKNLIAQKNKCQHEVEQGNEYCIFHLPKKTPEGAIRFESALRSEIKRQLKDKKANALNFIGYYFPLNIGFDFPSRINMSLPLELLPFTFVKERHTISLNLNFSYATFQHSFFTEATLLGDVNFSHVNFAPDTFFLDIIFSGYVTFSNAELVRANFSKVDLKGADLRGADLRGVNLSRANLDGVNLLATNIYNTILEEANLSNANMGYTTIGNCDLANVNGIENIKHIWPSSIGADTIIISFNTATRMNQGTSKIVKFYKASGVPKELLDILPQALAKIKYCTPVFVCYGQPDLNLATKLKKGLKKGVSCWLYSLDSTPGDRTWSEIGQRRREAEKMVVLCSSKALVRDGVLKEIEEQIDEDPEKIIPISLDDLWKEKGFKVMRANRDLKPFLLERNYADFGGKSNYDKSLNRLLKGLERKIV